MPVNKKRHKFQFILKLLNKKNTIHLRIIITIKIYPLNKALKLYSEYINSIWKIYIIYKLEIKILGFFFFIQYYYNISITSSL